MPTKLAPSVARALSGAHEWLTLDTFEVGTWPIPCLPDRGLDVPSDIDRGAAAMTEDR